MRVTALYDIHGNLPIGEAVLEVSKKGVDLGRAQCGHTKTEFSLPQGLEDDLGGASVALVSQQFPRRGRATSETA